MEKERNIIEGISTLTTIDAKALAKLVSIAEMVIVDEVAEKVSKGESTAVVDIGIGLLHVHFTGESIKFKFTPNAKFEEAVVDACIHKENLLDVKIEEALKNRIVNTYKDLL